MDPGSTAPQHGAERELRVDMPFLILVGLFMAALVVCNLIMGKFIQVDLGVRDDLFTLSVGVLPYPITFLVTDVLSEIYGRRRANQVVVAGFVASLFVLLVLYVGGVFPAMQGSRVDDATYDTVFGLAPRAILASMVAYLVAQLCDIRLFHFWKRLTRGRHLWLRNNASTILSQLVDSTLVITLLFFDDPGWTAQGIRSAIWDVWIFKMLVALADTPLCYLAVGLLRPRSGCSGP